MNTNVSRKVYKLGVISMEFGLKYFTFKISYSKFPVKLSMDSILHITINNLVVVSIKSVLY